MRPATAGANLPSLVDRHTLPKSRLMQRAGGRPRLPGADLFTDGRTLVLSSQRAARRDRPQNARFAQTPVAAATGGPVAAWPGAAAVRGGRDLASGPDETEQAWHRPAAAGSRLLRFVHRGRDRRPRADARSDYESDSGGVLAARHKSRDPQAPSGCPRRRPTRHPSLWQSTTPSLSASATERRRRRASRVCP
jgi:hypothetical protein